MGAVKYHSWGIRLSFSKHCQIILIYLYESQSGKTSGLMLHRKSFIKKHFIKKQSKQTKKNKQGKKQTFVK